MEFIDTHAHLYMKKYRGKLPNILREAQEAGIAKIIVPSSDPESIDSVIDMTEKWKKKIVAVGETGLDFHYNFSPRNTQIEVFKKHIEMAERFNLPVIIHMRKSFSEIKKVLDSFSKLPGALVHCFGGTLDQAKYFLDKGIFLSFTGTVTFDKSDKLAKIINSIPLDNFFLETDSPYLTPEPLRGQTNHPKHVKLIAQEIAEIKGLEIEDIARITTKNASMFFGIPFDNTPCYYFVRGKTLYLNITNLRNTRSDFTSLFRYPYLKGYNLHLNEEPSAEKLKLTIQNNILKIQNVVFLDYGEPTLREETLKEVAKFAKEMKLKTVLDTDGLANRHYQRNFAVELRGLFDGINVTVNASNPKEYQHFHRPPFGEESFREVLNFITECNRIIPSVRIQTVELPDLNVENCKKIAIEDLKAGFEVRKFIN